MGQLRTTSINPACTANPASWPVRSCQNRLIAVLSNCIAGNSKSGMTCDASFIPRVMEQNVRSAIVVYNVLDVENCVRTNCPYLEKTRKFLDNGDSTCRCL